MIKIPRIAVFKTLESESQLLQSVFQRHEYSMRWVERLSEVEDLISDEGNSFDVAVIPLRLSDQSSGITACIQLKSNPALASIPILGLSSSKDKAVIQAFYGAGADVVYVPPFDADLVYLQLSALGRNKRAFDEEIRLHAEDLGLRHSAMQALHCSRDALLIFDRDSKVVFANQTAFFLLGITSTESTIDSAFISDTFNPLIKSHIEKHPSRPAASVEERSSFTRRTLTRSNDRGFSATISIVTITSTRGETVGFGVSVRDRSEVEQLANLLGQSQRALSLSLFAASGLQHIPQIGGTPTIASPILRTEAIQAQEPLNTKLGDVLTSLLEALDLIINPVTSIKVSVSGDWSLAIRRGDLFKLLGAMIMDGVEYCSMGGEVTLDAKSEDALVYLIVVSESKRITPYPQNDEISELIRGRSQVSSEENPNAQDLSMGLRSAQEIAKKYSSEIEYQDSGAGLMKTRVKLALVQTTPSTRK